MNLVKGVISKIDLIQKQAAIYFKEQVTDFTYTDKGMEKKLTMALSNRAPVLLELDENSELKEISELKNLQK